MSDAERIVAEPEQPGASSSQTTGTPVGTGPADLGPAVTEDFPSAPGLQELVKADAKQPVAVNAGPAAPQVPAVQVGPELFVSTLKLIDRIASRALRVDVEPVETIQELAGAITPLAQYYAARGESTAALLWGNFGIALAGAAYMKYERVQERERVERQAATDQAASAAAKPQTEDGTHGAEK